MKHIWGPSTLGRLLTSSPAWRLCIDGTTFSLDLEGRSHVAGVLSLAGMVVKRGLLWSMIRVPGADGQILSLGGISNLRAAKLEAAVVVKVGAARRQLRIAELATKFDATLQAVANWVSAVVQASSERIRTRGWLTREFIEEVELTKPSGLEQMLAEPEFVQLLKAQPQQVQDAVATWQRPFAAVASATNRAHLTRTLEAFRPFFDTVEKSPLTREQAEAVICLDSRVLLIAAAGSGKTSTMVAKVGYALTIGCFGSDRILLLAFNTAAAAELRARIRARLTPLGLPTEQVSATTFHAFGLDVIGKATGKRPSLAPWVENGRDLEVLLQMVDELRETDLVFRTQWDLFRLVFAEDLPKFGAEESNPEDWDRSTERSGFRTLNNEVVRSRGELLIANWLFYNGVRYVYEASYVVDTADADHRQYRPDFYLPDVDAYLEHWAVDARGEPPREFVGYKEGMAWKRRIHAETGTRLLETTMAGVWSGAAFRYLQQELTKLGLVLDPNPDRDVAGPQPIEAPRLARTIRSFLTHAKSNRLTVVDLRRRVNEGSAGHFRFRHEMFLSIFEKLWALWEARLRAEQTIDFDDMLNRATECLEDGSWTSPYELIMVDEFQDASQARARLLAALVSRPGRHLFAVGDDWQSINRFAGADLSVMTDFEGYFGKAVTLRMQTTFRCPQALCDISSGFVLRNPRQLPKSVLSASPDVAEPLQIVSVPDDSSVRSAVEATVARIVGEQANADPRRKISISVLGRYRRDQAYSPRNHDPSRVDVEFITIHSSKGLEADQCPLEGLQHARASVANSVRRSRLPV